MDVGNLVPMFPAVYGDHVMRLGCFIGRPDTWGKADGFYSKLGLSFTWGEQLGWIMFGVLSNFEEPKLEPLRTFLASLAQTRSAALEFLAFGEMLKPLAMDNIPELPVDWNDWAKTRHGRLPAVLSTIWRSSRGTVGIALCNWTGKERRILLSPRPDWKLSGQLAYRVCRDGQWSTRTPLPANGLSLAAPAHTGMVIEIAGVPGASVFGQAEQRPGGGQPLICDFAFRDVYWRGHFFMSVALRERLEACCHGSSVTSGVSWGVLPRNLSRQFPLSSFR